jgi:acyl carrier protein
LTGDRVYLNNEGDYCWIGRSDSQVKVKGYRIELEEVNLAIRTVSGNAWAWTLAWPYENGLAQGLVSFLIEQVTVTHQYVPTIIEKLRTHLPSYMIPDRIILIKEIPLNSNGKLDRESLFKMLNDQSGDPMPLPNLETVSPSSVKEQLRNIWKRILKTSTIQDTDSFCDLGGESIQFIRLCAEIKAIFKIEPPIETFIRNPTIQGMATRIEDILLREK